MAAGGSAGVSADDAKLVQGHWTEVKKNLTGIGVDIFMAMFQQHPEYQKLFPKFSNVPLSELRGNSNLVKHATMVMEALTTVVGDLSKPAENLEKLRQLGRKHAKFHLTEAHFQTIRKAILDVLKQKLGSKMDGAAEKSWNKVLDFVFSGMMAGVQEGLKQTK
ncbi:myoglobin-like [Bacillus rossius redtenbacheri]|uniref:myoglobin-like n=1 Tax=Bacillus rossius redtenbacheri TaxID=93214 RepID=UPI002FDD2D06